MYKHHGSSFSGWCLYLWFLSKSWKTTWRQSKEFLFYGTICSSVRKNPTPGPAYPLIKRRVCREGAQRSPPLRTSNASPVCVKVSGARNLLDTQSGGQVFRSDVINHSCCVQKTALSPFLTYFCLRGSRGSFSSPEGRTSLLPPNPDMW